MLSLAATLVGLAVAPSAAPPPSPHTGHPATCARQSGASFPAAYADRGNLVAGPLAMVGAGRATSRETAERFGGNKFPALVRAGHTVTVTVARRARGSAALRYATESRRGHRTVTFRACSARRAMSDADGAPVTFWSGFVVVARPMCVPLKVWVDDAPARRTRIALGRSCAA